MLFIPSVSQASFSGVAVDEVGTYDLTFTSSEPGIADVEHSLTVTVGPADRLRFVSQPADGSPAAEGIAFTGEVIDAGGNRVTGVMGSMYSSVISGYGNTMNRIMVDACYYWCDALLLMLP